MLGVRVPDTLMPRNQGGWSAGWSMLSGMNTCSWRKSL